MLTENAVTNAGYRSTRDATSNSPATPLPPVNVYNSLDGLDGAFNELQSRVSTLLKRLEPIVCGPSVQKADDSPLKADMSPSALSRRIRDVVSVVDRMTMAVEDTLQRLEI